MKNHLRRLVISLSFIIICLFGAPRVYAISTGIQPSFNVPVLIYHHFAPSGLNIDYNGCILNPSVFEKQMKYLVDNGYRFVSLRELFEAMRHGAKLPSKPVVITMDDGYRSNYVYAYPILKKYQVRTTIFLITGLIGDTPAAFDPSDFSYLSWPEIKEMQASGLVDFQSHTHNLHHFAPLDKAASTSGPALTSNIFIKEPPHLETAQEYKDRITRDLIQSREDLKTHLGTEIFALAFPFGAHNLSVRQVAQDAGYQLLLTTRSGLVRRGHSPLEVRRINISRSDTMKTFAEKLVQGYVTPKPSSSAISLSQR